MDSIIEVIIYGVIGSISAAVIHVYIWKQRRNSRNIGAKIEQAKLEGLFEPVSLHPVVNPDACIQTGACILACPEKDILGIRNGKATTINTSRCIGHGACFRACPTQAITLCIGTETRGVELPHVNPDFETNVPGIYIAGELGGMGLIRNAVEQGKQAVGNIVRKGIAAQHAQYDITIIGAGPAGIAASLEAKKCNLRCLTLEQETLGGTVFTFPRSKVVMTAPMDLPLYGKIKLYETSKSELLSLWTEVIQKNNIEIRENSKVEAIVPEDGHFRIETLAGVHVTSKYVILAIGRRGTPRKLGVPGEGSEKVAYRLPEPELVKGKDVVVVGGGDAAIESALLLAPENRVVLSYRGEAFSRIKPKNQDQINKAIASGAVEVKFNTNLVNIEKDQVTFTHSGQPGTLTVKNDLVYIFAGGELPTRLLQKAGIRITTKFGEALLLLWMLIFMGSVSGQISPGKLAAVHTHLEGLSNCTQCHTLGDKVTNAKCLACHTEIKSRIDMNKGYHVSPDVKGKNCTGCHSDHHGLQFQIIRFDKNKFDHNLTGYKLTGAHAFKTCTDCHKSAFISNLPLRKKRVTYLGLTQNCLTCHADYHQKNLSENCTDCHSDVSFKPAVKFSHDRSQFKLIGKHQSVPCESCHKTLVRNGKPFRQYSGVLHRSCANCHKDVHQNKFGTQCSRCHTEVSFKTIRNISGFDHSKTTFPLTGKHLETDCRACHKSNLTDPLKHGRCVDCHSDYHTGQFVVQGVVRDCGDCHSTNGFQGSSFTIDRHEQTAFKLQGAHLATPCIACHKKTEKWEFRGIGNRCIDCHTDIHKEYLSAAFYPDSDCRSCHTSKQWNEIVFDHRKTRFNLTGAHALQTCRSCHFPKEKNGQTKQQFAGLASACTNCHTDIHYGQFNESGATNCLRCHKPEHWSIGSFDHDKTSFKLDGQHQKVPCYKCHKPVSLNNQVFILYKIKESKCENCH
ncbi:MAG: 4Fe-4S dicluster domain-containing protein [Alphaproteobacteria bacterium]|nr:4Fe-4S dicluster domain-containing protein [Alphaproteobacteria bacterium]